MNSFFSCLLFVSFFYVSLGALSMEQIKESFGLVRKICQPKSKLSDEVIDKMSEGIFPEDKASKCFIQCALENLQMMKKNKVNYDAALRQMESILPDDIKGDFINSLTICKDSANGEKNACEAAHKVVTCIHANNPSFMFV